MPSAGLVSWASLAGVAGRPGSCGFALGAHPRGARTAMRPCRSLSPAPGGAEVHRYAVWVRCAPPGARNALPQVVRGQPFGPAHGFRMGGPASWAVPLSTGSAAPTEGNGAAALRVLTRSRRDAPGCGLRVGHCLRWAPHS